MKIILVLVIAVASWIVTLSNHAAHAMPCVAETAAPTRPAALAQDTSSFSIIRRQIYCLEARNLQENRLHIIERATAFGDISTDTVANML